MCDANFTAFSCILHIRYINILHNAASFWARQLTDHFLWPEYLSSLSRSEYPVQISANAATCFSLWNLEEASKNKAKSPMTGNHEYFFCRSDMNYNAITTASIYNR